MTTEQEPCLFKLGEYPVYRGQANFFVILGQGHKDVFGAKVRATILMKKVQDFHAWTGRLEANIA